MQKSWTAVGTVEPEYGDIVTRPTPPQGLSVQGSWMPRSICQCQKRPGSAVGGTALGSGGRHLNKSSSIKASELRHPPGRCLLQTYSKHVISSCSENFPPAQGGFLGVPVAEHQGQCIHSLIVRHRVGGGRSQGR